MIKIILRDSSLKIHDHNGFNHYNISTHYIQLIWSVDLIFGGIDPNHISIIGHWYIDDMFRYLQSHTPPLIHENSGSFSKVEITPLSPATIIIPLFPLNPISTILIFLEYIGISFHI